MGEKHASMIKQFLAAALIVSASASAFAQQPTEDTRPSQSQQQQQPSNQFNSRDYTRIQSSEVPASLRTTLQSDTYKGWESGTIYRHNNGNGYYITTGTGSNDRVILLLEEVEAGKDVIITDQLYSHLLACTDRLFCMASRGAMPVKGEDHLTSLGYLA